MKNEQIEECPKCTSEDIKTYDGAKECNECGHIHQ